VTIFLVILQKQSIEYIFYISLGCFLNELISSHDLMLHWPACT